uniref:hypothetical protein n=1 Tax=Alistipes sp. TaxID=1872444 RepID=UPI004056B2AF
MILMEYARNPKPREIARKFGLSHHSYVTRLWEKLPDEKKDEYRNKAMDIHEQVAEEIATKDFEFVKKTANRMISLMDKAMDEWKARLSDQTRRNEIPAKELTNFIRLCQNFVIDNTNKPGEGADETPSSNHLYQLLNHSISDHLNSSEE